MKSVNYLVNSKQKIEMDQRALCVGICSKRKKKGRVKSGASLLQRLQIYNNIRKYCEVRGCVRVKMARN